MIHERTRSSWPQDGASWQILGFKIKSWNFQHMLELWLSEPTQNLSSFGQLIFSLFHMGDQREKFKKPMDSLGRYFGFFPLVPPFNKGNKSCSSELKFWEGSESHKSSICWKFHVEPRNLPRWSGPFDYIENTIECVLH